MKEEEESTFTSMVSKVLETIESDSDHEEAESDPTEIRNAEIPLADQINEEIDRFSSFSFCFRFFEFSENFFFQIRCKRVFVLWRYYGQLH